MPLVDLRGQKTRRSPEELVKHLQSFELELKFSAGIWYFSPAASRFHDYYKPILDIEQRLEIAAKLEDYGLSALEAHYPTEINEDNLDLWKSFVRDTGIRLLTVVPGLFYDADFEFGSLSSPIPSVRQKAIERTIITLRLCKEFDCDFAIVWPGIDGYENNFGVDFYGMWDRFEEGLAQAMDEVPGVRIAIEPKPYEPRGNNIYRMTADGILAAKDIEARLTNPENKKLLEEGHALVCLNPEIGHILMGTEDVPYCLARIMREGRLAHTHWNSQPLGNYDQDLNVGVVGPEITEAALFVLKMYGYTSYLGIDINPERQPVDVALKICMDALRAAADRINSLDYEKVVWAMMHPDKARGWLEAYLIRMRALHPEKLPPLWELPMD